MSQDLTDFIQVAASTDLPEGGSLGVEVNERPVLLVRIHDVVHAYGNECPHKGAPLADGLVAGDQVVCPYHQARFSLASGAVEHPPARDDLPVYDVAEVDGAIFVGPEPLAEPAERKPAPPVLKSQAFVIVGAGAAGCAAAEELRRRGFAGRIRLLTPEPNLPYDRTDLSKGYLAGASGDEDLPLRDAGFYRRQEITLLTESRVDRVDAAARQVELADGERIAFDQALIATGSRPRQLEVPGAELQGLFSLRSWIDASELVGELAGAGRVVIVGAGFIGLEAAASLRGRGLEVALVAPEPVPLGPVFGEPVGRWLQGLAEAEGVHFHLGRGVKRLEGDQRVRRVQLSDDTALEADLVLIAIGVEPRLGPLAGSGLVERGAVPVDERLQTRADFVFAAGDIARLPSPPDGPPRRVEHWAWAETQGRHAARAMLGDSTPFDEPPFFWTRQWGKSLQLVGHSAGFDRVELRGEVEAGDFLAGYYRNGELVAAAGAGRSREMIALGQLLRSGRAAGIAPAAFAAEDHDLVALAREAG